MTIYEKLSALQKGKPENHILPFFWQHGEDNDTLRHYMQVIHNANIGAVCVESRPHPDFVGKLWWENMDTILDEAEKLGMKVWILDDSHFPTGYANGAVEKAPMELTHQYLDHNDLTMAGPRRQMEIPVARLSHPKPAPPWIPQPKDKKVWGDDHTLGVVAYQVLEKGKLANPVDLSNQIQDGRIIWDVPAGTWKIFVLYLTRDANGRNNYINFVDKASCRLLIDAVYQPHYDRYADKFGTTIAGFFSDEPPIGNTPGYTIGDLIGRPGMPLPWSGMLAERMDDACGADWKIQLPLLWAKGELGDTARIRTGYMNVCSKLVAECFSQQLGDWCSEHGVEYIGHMLEDCDMNAGLGPSMGHFFRGLSGQHMAGIDNIGGQVMPGFQNVPRHSGSNPVDEASFYQYTLGRMGASMAAVYPQQKGRCLCENFGAYGWQTGVRLEKYLVDHFLARGVNYFVPHAFTPKAFPDPDCPPHFYAHGENPQYRAFGELMTYTNRICTLIEGGKPVTPVALLYHGESQWGGWYQSNIAVCRELTRHQIGFTMLPADVFEYPEQFGTEFDPASKTFKVNGISFGAFVVCGCDSMTAPAAEFAAKASQAGFPVIFTEQLPQTIGDRSAEEAAAILHRLSGCTVTPLSKLAEVLIPIGRDVQLEEAWPDLTVYRYQNGGEVVLLLNEDNGRRFTGKVKLPVSGYPVRYDPWDNRLLNVEASQDVDGVELTLDLAPLEMCVLLVGSDRPETEAVHCAENTALPLENFLVSRCESREYPHFHDEETPNLQNGMQTLHPQFSGYYRYQTTFTLQNPGVCTLSIEDVGESAEVFVNDIRVGMRTAQPYCFDLTSAVKTGENTLVIEVATTLERKIASMGLDPAAMGVPAPLSPTGILGTVKLYY